MVPYSWTEVTVSKFAPAVGIVVASTGGLSLSVSSTVDNVSFVCSVLVSKAIFAVVSSVFDGSIVLVDRPVFSVVCSAFVVASPAFVANSSAFRVVESLSESIG
jgi:hypothetical protein